MSHIPIYRFTPHSLLQKEKVWSYMYMYFHFQESNTLQYFLFEHVANEVPIDSGERFLQTCSHFLSTEEFIFWIGSIFNGIFVFFKTCNLRILKTIYTFVHFLFSDKILVFFIQLFIYGAHLLETHADTL